MPNTKPIQPATPLPWDTLYAATAFCIGVKVREQNSAFAVHAANAYPELVAMLKMHARCEHGGNAAFHLLAKLGEG